MIAVTGILSACMQGVNESVKNEAKVFNETAEVDSIMKVIENETQYFFDGNYEDWSKTWSHESYAMQAWNNEDGNL